MKKSKIAKYLCLRRNIKNWKEYTFKKHERTRRSLEFISKPYPVRFQVNANNYVVFKEIFVEDFYDLPSFIGYLPDNATIIDIGANVGFFPVLVLSKKPAATFYCYEPLPSNIIHLESMKKENPGIADQLKIFPFAVTGDSEGFIELYTEENPDESSIASIHKNFDDRNRQSLRVPVTNLASIITGNNIDRVDVLKMDCEGAEYTILYNTPAAILEKIRFILLEVHNLDNDQQNVRALNIFLNENGFSTTTQPFHNNCFYVFAKR